MRFFANCVTYRGKAHRIEDLPCQDSSAYLVTPSSVISIVADGHGNQVHVRSNYGSRMAVDVSMKILSSELTHPITFKNKLRKSGEKYLQEIEKKIITEWMDAISVHFRRYNLTEEESESVEKSKYGIPLDQVEVYYGTTLSISVLSSTFAFAMQIGDSPIYCIKPDYSLDERYVPENEKCVGRYTTSLCDPNALDEFRHHYSVDNEIPLAFLICSDGFSKSYDPLDLSYRVKSTICLSSTMHYWQELVSKRIWECSTKGSLDDTSVSVSYSDKLNFNRFYSFVFGSKCKYDLKAEQYSPNYKLRFNGYYENNGDLVEEGYWQGANNNSYYGTLKNGCACDIYSDLPQYSDGDRTVAVLHYTGDVSNNEKNGEGEEDIEIYLCEGKNESPLRTWPHYKGSFKDGKYSGFGKEYDGKMLVFQGHYEEGIRWGQGERYNLIDGETETIQGHFEGNHYLDSTTQHILDIIAPLSFEESLNPGILTMNGTDIRLSGVYETLVRDLRGRNYSGLNESVFRGLMEKKITDIKKSIYYKKEIIPSVSDFVYYLLKCILSKKGLIVSNSMAE